MRKRTYLFFTTMLIFSLSVAFAQSKVVNSEIIIKDGLKFNESTLPYLGGILIANFGSDELNPLNNQGKGYIYYYKNGKVRSFIKPNGYMNAPKGMLVKNSYLYVCDVNKLLIYDLKKPNTEPQKIVFPKDDLFLNDLVSVDNTLYISVTNTGNIYSLDISKPYALEQKTLTCWINVVGANGLLIDGTKMYIASYPADGKTTDDNVIYVIKDIKNPKAEKFFKVPGQYDGMAFSNDKKWLYITNWTPAQVIAIEMASLQAKEVKTDATLSGPADISIINNRLYIPDLPNSRVITLPIPYK